MAIQVGQVIDEVRLSSITMTMGTPKIIAAFVMGTRDENDQFVWSRKEVVEIYPDTVELPKNATTKEVMPHIRTLPESLMKEMRKMLIAIEDSLQVEVEEEAIALPATVGEMVGRNYTDPRIEVDWQTTDGHNSEIQPPTPKARIELLKKKI